MEPIRLHRLSPSLKWALSAYFILSLLGFSIAAMISHDRYDWDHERTVVYYQGDEAQMAYPKPYGQLITAAHVHSFTMPLLFLVLWLVMAGVPLNYGFKKSFIVGGALSILIYNGAPFLVRYGSSRWAVLFTVGGVGLFFFYVIPTLSILRELWCGRGEKSRS